VKMSDHLGTASAICGAEEISQNGIRGLRPVLNNMSIPPGVNFSPRGELGPTRSELGPTGGELGPTGGELTNHAGDRGF
jgi:hypothetical protein